MEKITYVTQFDLAMESILLLSRRYSIVQRVPNSVETILENMQESYGIPVQELSEQLTPVRAVEAHILNGLQVPEDELTFYFGDGTPYMGGLAWAFYFLEKENVSLQSLEGESLLRELRHLVCLALDDTVEGLDRVVDLKDFIEFLDTTTCSLHLKWCCTKVWGSPVQYQQRFHEILNQAMDLFQEVVSFDAVQKETSAQIESLFRGVPLDGLEPVNPAEERAEVILRPSLIAFNGAMRLWDPARPADPAYLFVGVLQRQIADLVRRYGNNSENLLSALRTISDKRRFEILQALKERPWYGFELAKRLSTSPCVVSHHMNYLLHDRLVRQEKQGTKICYSLASDELNRFLQNLTNALSG